MRNLLFLLLFSLGARAGQTNAPDAWLQGAARHPQPFATNGILETNRFAALHAEAVSGQVLVTWPAQPGSASEGKVFLASSADPPGHWPSRDWRSRPMVLHGTTWQANIETDSIEVPLVYFVVAVRDGVTNLSPLRICHPRVLGLEHSSRLFWPFLEGFEQGLQSWRALGGDELRLSSTAKNGKAALSVRVAENRRSVVVATTRLRGWFAEEHRATGLAFWMRTTAGTGTVRCTLAADALTTNEVAAVQANTLGITSQWQRYWIAFGDYPKFPLGELDLVAFECAAASGTEFLLDNLHLTGSWLLE